MNNVSTLIYLISSKLINGNKTDNFFLVVHIFIPHGDNLCHYQSICKYNNITCWINASFLFICSYTWFARQFIFSFNVLNITIHLQAHWFQNHIYTKKKKKPLENYEIMSQNDFFLNLQRIHSSALMNFLIQSILLKSEQCNIS